MENPKTSDHPIDQSNEGMSLDAYKQYVHTLELKVRELQALISSHELTLKAEELNLISK